ncbi:hypothetical protein VNI00_015775 [Paramarasmius palmivorus]|uniref:Uncharacterized protein n=1 Tax=Paramarasmius palmivorus TaxID=297713 RepID=A0AAW0BIY0_9AGAR
MPSNGLLQSRMSSVHSADWPTHKAQCKWNATISARQAAEKAAKLAKGEVYYDDNVLVAWFKRNSNVIEYAAFHALELWKGPVHSKFATHIACFDVEVDDQHADDDKRVRFHDAMLMSRDIVAMGGPTAERVKDALGKGYMPLMISDVDHQLKIMEFLPYPTHIHKDGPDKNWEIDTFLRLNGLAMGLC